VPIPGLSVPGRVVSLKGQSRLASIAASQAPKLLGELEKYFGRPMPYPKLDLVSVPEFLAGAMENPGLITFRENFLLLDSAEADLDRKRDLASIMAHEMAHLWFGDLVTMTWWDDLWLNEGFASWMGDRTVDAAFPEFKLPIDAVGGRQWGFSVDGMETARAIRTRVLPTDNPNQSFDALAYSKGQEVLGMLEGWMGAGTFRKGIQSYMGEFAWKNTVADDLWRHLSAAAGRDVAPVTATFLDQPGVPLVHMTQEGKSLRLKQGRFLLSGAADTAGRQWKIPMVLKCLVGDSTHRLAYLLESPEAEVPVPFASEGMVCHPNDGERGYYRWNLAPEALDALARSAPRLSERERVALGGNLLALSESGALGADALLGRLPSLMADTSVPALHHLLFVLEKADERFIDSAGEADFARFVSDLLHPILDRIGWNARPGESAEYPSLRAGLVEKLAGYAKDPRALAYADSLAALHAKARRKVDPSLVRTVLRISARRGGLDLFRRRRAAFLAAETPVLRADLLASMASFEGPLADSALALPLQGILRPHEYLSVVRVMTSRRPHRDQALQWVMDHFEDIRKALPPHTLVYLPWNASYSGEAWRRAQPFFRGLQGNIAGLDKEMAKAAEKVRLLEAMQARDKAKVAAFLAAYSAESKVSARR
jgi:alanyl aminopeptidase